MRKRLSGSSLLARRFLSKPALSTRQCGKQRQSSSIHSAAKAKFKELIIRDSGDARVSLGQKKALKSQFVHYKRFN
jgi:hypothetical protein